MSIDIKHDLNPMFAFHGFIEQAGNNVLNTGTTFVPSNMDAEKEAISQGYISLRAKWELMTYKCIVGFVFLIIYIYIYI